MAQLLKELVSKYSNGIPKGSSTGLALLFGAGLVGYGVKEALYTVDGGHRAIIFSRIGGIQNEVYAEGLHFRFFIFHNIYEL